MQAPLPIASWITLLDAADKVVKIGAIIVGGVWAYYKFIKGRFYRPRLEASVSGEPFRIDNRDYVSVSISLRNVGTSKVEIRQEGTALRVFCSPVNSTYEEAGGAFKGGEVVWNRITSLSIFENHGWIESSELIHDKLLVSLPPAQLAVRLDVRIVGQGLEWEAKAIVKVDTVQSAVVLSTGP
jgi:hypothetical protein